MADPTNEANTLPDVHPGNLAPLLCHRLGIPGCVVLLSFENGTIMQIAHGVTHARANEMLSRGVQINLNQHDEFVRDGLAGVAAAQHQAALDGVEHQPAGAMQ